MPPWRPLAAAALLSLAAANECETQKKAEYCAARGPQGCEDRSPDVDGGWGCYCVADPQGTWTEGGGAACGFPVPSPTGDFGCNYIPHCWAYQPGGNASRPEECRCGACEDLFELTPEEVCIATTAAPPTPAPPPPRFTPLCTPHWLSRGILEVKATLGHAPDAVPAIRYDVWIPATYAAWGGFGVRDPAATPQGMRGLDVIVVDGVKGQFFDCETVPDATWAAGGRPTRTAEDEATSDLLQLTVERTRTHFVIARKLRTPSDVPLVVNQTMDFAFAHGTGTFTRGFHEHTAADRYTANVTLEACAELLPYLENTPAPPPGPFGCRFIDGCELYGPGDDPADPTSCVCGRCYAGYNLTNDTQVCEAHTPAPTPTPPTPQPTTPQPLPNITATTATQVVNVTATAPNVTSNASSTTATVNATVSINVTKTTAAPAGGNATATNVSGGNVTATATNAKGNVTGTVATPVPDGNVTNTTPVVANSTATGKTNASSTVALMNETAEPTSGPDGTDGNTTAAAEGGGFVFTHRDAIYGCVTVLLLVCGIVWCVAWWRAGRRRRILGADGGNEFEYRDALQSTVYGDADEPVHGNASPLHRTSLQGGHVEYSRAFPSNRPILGTRQDSVEVVNEDPFSQSLEHLGETARSMNLHDTVQSLHLLPRQDTYDPPPSTHTAELYQRAKSPAHAMLDKSPSIQVLEMPRSPMNDALAVTHTSVTPGRRLTRGATKSPAYLGPGNMLSPSAARVHSVGPGDYKGLYGPRRRATEGAYDEGGKQINDFAASLAAAKPRVSKVPSQAGSPRGAYPQYPRGRKRAYATAVGSPDNTPDAGPSREPSGGPPAPSPAGTPGTAALSCARGPSQLLMPDAHPGMPRSTSASSASPGAASFSSARGSSQHLMPNAQHPGMARSTSAASGVSVASASPTVVPLAGGDAPAPVTLTSSRKKPPSRQSSRTQQEIDI